MLNAGNISRCNWNVGCSFRRVYQHVKLFGIFTYILAHILSTHKHLVGICILVSFAIRYPSMHLYYIYILFLYSYLYLLFSIFISIYIHIYTYIHIFVYVFICICLNLCICVFACVYAGIYVCVYGCLRVCVLVSACVCAHRQVDGPSKKRSAKCAKTCRSAQISTLAAL